MATVFHQFHADATKVDLGVLALVQVLLASEIVRVDNQLRKLSRKPLFIVFDPVRHQCTLGCMSHVFTVAVVDPVSILDIAVTIMQLQVDLDPIFVGDLGLLLALAIRFRFSLIRHGLLNY